MSPEDLPIGGAVASPDLLIEIWVGGLDELQDPIAVEILKTITEVGRSVARGPEAIAVAAGGHGPVACSCKSIAAVEENFPIGGAVSPPNVLVAGAIGGLNQIDEAVGVDINARPQVRSLL